MYYDQKLLEEKLSSILSHFREELNTLRTGRPSISQFEHLTVDTEAKYGSKMQLNSLAKISISGLSVEIEVWDQNLINEVRKALESEEIKGSINSGRAKNIFIINFNPITEEDRKENIKILKKKLEDRKIAMRLVRQNFMEQVRKIEKAPEDEIKKSEETIQKTIDQYIQKLDDLSMEKEKDLLSIN